MEIERMRANCRQLLMLIIGCVQLVAFGQQTPSKPCKPQHGYDSDAWCNEVTIGAEIWSYNRIFPLLDGLFQDLASTQLTALILNPNSTNGSQLDALTQSFQLQVGFNQMSALQNQAAAQMLTSNTALQSLLVQQQGMILQQQLTAQQQLDAAQQKQNADTNSSADVKAADALAVQQAQTNVNSLAGQMTLVTSQLKTTSSAFSPSPATGNMASATATPSALPSTFATPYMAGPSSSTAPAPSFPATKQMDNQVQLLWERISRLMGGMTKPDSSNRADHIYLVQFDTGIFPVRRKNQLLQTNYELGCADGKGGPPTVLDIFPRMAAVNITDTKYRDSSVGFGAVLAWMGFGVNAAYNREHLRISQLLGQSSYITGFGVGQSTFGWKFGIPLGDDQIPPDTFNTFALISVPATCNTPSLKLSQSTWSSKDGREESRQDNDAALTSNFQNLSSTLWNNVVANDIATTTSPAHSTQPALVRSVAFNRAEYNPSAVTASTPVSVGLTIELTRDLDQQQIVTVNGVLIKRARDAFARAVNSGGSGGLLEVSTLAVNSWVPLSSRTLLLNLDGTMFGQHFPTIQLASPSGIDNLNNDLARQIPCPPITVSGRRLFGPKDEPCLSVLPSIALKAPATRIVGVARWIQGSPGNPQKARLVFTVLGSATPSSAGNATTVSTVQISSTAEQAQWGSNTEVYEIQGSGEMIRLDCDPSLSTGSRLTCNLPPQDYIKGNYNAESYQVIDTNHIVDINNSVAPIQGWANIGACSFTYGNNTCNTATFWDIQGPTLNRSLWTLVISFVNVDLSTQQTVGLLENNKAGVWSCRPDHDTFCTATFEISPAEILSFSDEMTLVLHPNSGLAQAVKISNLRTNIQPTISSFQSQTDFNSWAGLNLSEAFTFVKVGQDGTSHKLLCQNGVTCTSEGFGKNEKGIVYFVAGTAAIPLMQRSSAGVSTFVVYPIPSSGKGAPGGGTTPTEPQTTINIYPAGSLQQSLKSTNPVSGTQTVVAPATPPAAPQN